MKIPSFSYRIASSRKHPFSLNYKATKVKKMEADLKNIFDPFFYRSKNPDLKHFGKNIYEHYKKFGFFEKRNPASWIDLAYCENMNFQLSRFTNTPEGLISFVSQLPANDIIGTSPFFSPLWINAQLKKKSGRMAALLDVDLAIGDSISFHPLLRSVKVMESGLKLKDVFTKTIESDLMALSILDLNEYQRQHEGLAAAYNGEARALLNHALTYGLTEKRFKYLDNQGFDSGDVRSNLMELIFLSYGNYVERNRLDKCRPFHCIPCRDIEIVPDPDFYPRLASIKSASCPASLLQNLLTFNASFGSGQTERRFYINKGSHSKKTKPVTITDLELLENPALLPKTRRVIYSANLGGYDEYASPPNLEDCLCVVFTDGCDVPEDMPWIPVRSTLNEVDKKRTCLFYKTHPHSFFPQARYVTWMDNNIRSHKGSEDLLAAHEVLSELASFSHPDRCCVYDECVAVERLKLDHSEIINRVVKAMRDAGMPENYGLFETNVLFSQPQDLAVRHFFDTWWKNISLGSRRDQVSFTYAAWLSNVDISPLEKSKSANRGSRFFSKVPHARPRGRSF